MKGILYIAHGTRSKKGEAEAKSFLQKVKTLVNVPIQETCFLELSHPSIAEGFRLCVEKGATEITVVPILLLAAGHIKRDIPEALTHIQKKFPHIKVTLKDAIGVHEEIFDAIVEQVKETVPDISTADGILIVGRGSSEEQIHAAFSTIELGIYKRLPTKFISTCYLAVAQPKFFDGLDRMLSNDIKRVIIIPYLLFSGVLLSEVISTCKKKGAHVISMEPLSRHKTMEGLVALIAMEEAKNATAIY